MNTKAKGSRAEHRSILLLESAGYVCTPAAASLGIFDVIGIGPTDVVLVQCKSRDWPSSIELESIRNFQCPPLWVGSRQDEKDGKSSEAEDIRMYSIGHPGCQNGNPG